MNPNMMFVSPDFISIKYMENMNAGFVAEGLTSRKRAIDQYMKSKGTKEDKLALNFLKDIGALDFSEEKTTATLLENTRDGLKKLRDHVRGAPAEQSKSDTSPLVLYALALCALEPRYGLYNFDLGWDCLVAAVVKGCDPARALYADMALRTPLSPADNDVRETLLGFLEDAIKAMSKDIFEARDEDLLLVMGRRFALSHTEETLLSYLVRKGLVLLAKTDHVDALRLLALDHASDPSRETLWAREEIMSQARRGRAHAMLIMGQHLSDCYFFWLPEGNREENLKRARNILVKRARKNDPWATLTLAWTYLYQAMSSREATLEGQDECPDWMLDIHRALDLLEPLALERNFAPAKIMLGALRFRYDQDPEAVWPLFRDACAQKFSRLCEAACAEFLLYLIINCLYDEVDREEGTLLDEDAYDDHGGARFWLMERLPQAMQHDHFGFITLAAHRLSLAAGELNAWDEVLSASDDCKDEDDQSKSERHHPLHTLTAILSGGRLAVHLYLVQLASEYAHTEQSDNILARIQADTACGNEDCIMADLLFTKRLFDADPCDITDLDGTCAGLAGGSNIARAVSKLLRIHLFFELEEDGYSDADEHIKKELYILEIEFNRALQCVDLPVLFALPVIFKYVKSQFSPYVVKKSIEYVTQELLGTKHDLKGFVAELNELPFTFDLDMNRLWKNLGLEPSIDFMPRTKHAGYESSAMRSRRAAEARKNARRKKAKLKKESLKKARRKKR